MFQPQEDKGGVVEGQEPIGVLATFHDRKVEPIAFHWGLKKYRVDKVNLSYRRRDQGRLYYHFAVTSGAGTYDLCYDSEQMEWRLWRVPE
jgi:hypothetical protein